MVRFRRPDRGEHRRRRGTALATGTVKWFNDDKGFGFITPDDQGADHFVHHSGINSDGFRTLREGARVSLRLRGRARRAQGRQRHRRSRTRARRPRRRARPCRPRPRGRGRVVDDRDGEAAAGPALRRRRARPVSPGARGSRSCSVPALDGTRLPGQLARLARPQRARRPRVHVGGVAALRALVEDPDRPRGVWRGRRRARCWPNATAASCAARPWSRPSRRRCGSVCWSALRTRA